MTKKDYIAIASMFKARLIAERVSANPANLRRDVTDVKEVFTAGVFAVQRCIDDFCNLAIRDNPRFDSSRFRKACDY